MDQQAWVCTIDVQAELTKRKQPCLEVTRGLPLPQLIQEDRNKLLALLKYASCRVTVCVVAGGVAQL